MKRHEALELLREISASCGDSILINSVNLAPIEESVQGYSNVKPRFKLCLNATLDAESCKRLMDIVQKHELQMNKDGDFLTIYRLKKFARISIEEKNAQILSSQQ